MGDSPVKKLNFDAAGKENVQTSDVVIDAKVTKPVAEKTEVAKQTPSIQELEASEPLLQENPRRFVLFPIKYHEVRSHVHYASRVNGFFHAPLFGILSFILSSVNFQRDWVG